MAQHFRTLYFDDPSPRFETKVASALQNLLSHKLDSESLPADVLTTVGIYYARLVRYDQGT